jgi:hypothetical protein
MSKWVTFSPDEVRLKAGKSKKISYIINVPLSSEPGGRYIALFANTDVDASGGTINSRKRVGLLLYITVLGDVTRFGNLASLSSPWLVVGKNIWSAAVQNTGTTHFRSRYDVQVKNLIGDTVVSSMSGDTLILPGSVRAISDTLPLPQLPGIYKIIYTIELGDTPATVQTRYFLYASPLTIIAFVAVVTVLTYSVLRRRLSKKH